MRSYEAARNLFGFLGFISWCVIILGGLIAFSAGGVAGNMGGFGRAPTGMAVFMAALPGVGLSFLGFLCLAIVQTGRASVDSAEYGQQMLQVARDQLEVSRQALRGGTIQASSFASIESNDAKKESGGSASFEQMSTEASVEPSRPSVEEKEVAFEYDVKGQKLLQNSDGTFRLHDKEFTSLEAVKDHIRLRSLQSKFSPES